MVTTNDSHYCDWCDDEIEPDDDHKTIIEGEPHRDAHVVARFHDGDLPCFSEAADYGWR